MTHMQAFAGAISGLFVVASEGLTTTTAGIAIFAVGIVVGLVCVIAVDHYTRRHFERDHRDWVAAGRPDRRSRERRA